MVFWHQMIRYCVWKYFFLIKNETRFNFNQVIGYLRPPSGQEPGSTRKMVVLILWSDLEVALAEPSLLVYVADIAIQFQERQRPLAQPEIHGNVA